MFALNLRDMIGYGGYEYEEESYNWRAPSVTLRYRPMQLTWNPFRYSPNCHPQGGKVNRNFWEHSKSEDLRSSAYTKIANNLKLTYVTSHTSYSFKLSLHTKKSNRAVLQHLSEFLDNFYQPESPYWTRSCFHRLRRKDDPSPTIVNIYFL